MDSFLKHLLFKRRYSKRNSKILLFSNIGSVQTLRDVENNFWNSTFNANYIKVKVGENEEKNQQLACFDIPMKWKYASYSNILLYFACFSWRQRKARHCFFQFRRYWSIPFILSEIQNVYFVSNADILLEH